MFSRTKTIGQVGIASAVVLSLLASSASADVLYDNTAAASTSFSYLILGSNPLYDSFSTGATSFDLNKIELVLAAANPSDGLSFYFTINSDSGGSPGASIFNSGNIGDNLLGTTLAVIASFFAPILLSPDTQYWIGVGTNDQGSVGWSFASDISGTGVAGAYHVATNGAVFANNNADNTGAWQMQVSGSSVGETPLPSTWTMMLIGFAGLGFFAFRGSKKGSAAIAAT